MRDLVTDFEAQRGHLTAVAYRMLGSRSEAEDAVQEAWLRYASLAPAARADIRDLRGWLTTTTGRICLDVLRSARVRRESYHGQWLPEPLVDRLPSETADPAESAARRDEVSTALLYVMERLSPEQRVAFVLHDAFAVPFDEIAAALGTSPEAARQLASRARKAVADGAPRNTADQAQQRRVLEAFLKASESGDIEGLMAVLAPDVVFVGDGGGVFPSARRPVEGALQVARFVRGLLRQIPAGADTMRSAVMAVNGGLGVVVEATYRGGAFKSVMSFAMDGDRITAVFNQLNPEKVARVPAVPEGEPDWPPAVNRPDSATS